MTRYLSVDELIQINREMVEAFGGMQGVRDRGALAAAAASPQSGYYQDIIEEGAAFVKASCRTIPFSTATRKPLLPPRLFSTK